MAITALPAPPRWLRPVLHALWPLVGVLVTLVAVPLVVLGAFLIVVDRKVRLFRITCLTVLLLWTDIKMLVGCWSLKLDSPKEDSPTWLEDHERLLLETLDTVVRLAHRWVGFEIKLSERMYFGSPDAPLIAFSRHAGPGDSLALAWLLAHVTGRLPRIVLAEALRWDPSIDTMLTRLHSYFVPSGTGAGDDRLRGVAALADSLGPKDVLLLFPEGQNWSPGRRHKLIDRLRKAGDTLRAGRASSLENVLPPKGRGVVACLTARPDADVMIVSHAGFGRLVTPEQIWNAVPFTDRPFLVRGQTYAAQSVPRDPAGIQDWIDEHWNDMDQWIRDNSPDPVLVERREAAKNLRERSGLIPDGLLSRENPPTSSDAAAEHPH